MSVSELRIHGVGGSPGERLLGLSHPDRAVVVGEGYGTVFLARRADRRVEGYDWGGLTSGSPWQPLWVLLLPFTLVNVAGWTHPPFDAISPRRLRLLRGLIHLSAGLLTATWVCWLAIIAVDHLGYQWLGSADGWLAGLAEGGLASPRVIGAAIGAAVVVLALWALGRIARTSRHRFEGTHPARDGAPPRRWGRDEDLTSRTFFAHEASVDDALSWHVGVMVATGLVLLWVTTLRFGEDRLLLGHVFVVLGAAQLAAVAAMLAVGWSARSGSGAARAGGTGRSGTGKSGTGTGDMSAGGVDAGGTSQGGDTEVAGAVAAELGNRPRGLPAAAVTLAIALTNGVFSGLALLAANLHGDHRPWGPELALIDGFVVALILWAVLVIGWLVRHHRGGSAEDVPERSSGPAAELDGLDAQQRRRVAGLRGLAAAGHDAARPLTWFAWLFLASAATLGAARVEPDGLTVWTWLPTPQVAGPLLSTAAWLLPLLVLGTVALVWRAARTDALRRGVGILWDVLTFWPRRYHPLAVRPYTERAVPEFRARVDHHLDVGDGLLVSAHSQGTVIAFAALLPLTAEPAGARDSGSVGDGADADGTDRHGTDSADGDGTDRHGTDRHGTDSADADGTDRHGTDSADDHAGPLGRVALLTYGSPLRTLYGPAFPAYAGPPARSALHAGLASGPGGWRNLWRRTDPIGGPVLSDLHPATEVDVECPDPAVGPTAGELPEVDDDPEPLRRAWAELCGHSYFYREQAYKDAVTDLCAGLRRDAVPPD